MIHKQDDERPAPVDLAVRRRRQLADVRKALAVAREHRQKWAVLELDALVLERKLLAEINGHVRAC